MHKGFRGINPYMGDVSFLTLILCLIRKGFRATEDIAARFKSFKKDTKYKKVDNETQMLQIHGKCLNTTP
jgi:hypothetical protein